MSERDTTPPATSGSPTMEPYNPKDKLRADATDEQIQARWQVGTDGKLMLPASITFVAREFAAACVAEVSAPLASPSPVAWRDDPKVQEYRAKLRNRITATLRTALDELGLAHREMVVEFVVLDRFVDALCDAVAASAGSPEPNFAQMGEFTRSTPISGYGVKYITARKHWHITLNGVDQSDTEPCFNDVNDALDLADALNAKSAAGRPLMSREALAGLLSTIEFQPSCEHPERCLSMADAILAAFDAPPTTPEAER